MGGVGPDIRCKRASVHGKHGLAENALVLEMPDRSAGHVRAGEHHFPYFPEIAAEGQAEGVGVFRGDIGPSRRFPFPDSLQTRIMGRVQVCLGGEGGFFPGTGIKDQSRRIQGTDLAGHPDRALADGFLVADAPDDDAGMAAVAEDGGLTPGNEIAHQGRVLVPPEIERDLASHIDSQAVAEIQLPLILGVMTAPKEIDIPILPHVDIPLQAFQGQGFPRLGVKVVGIDAAEFDGGSIEQQDPVLHGDFPDAHLLPQGLDRSGPLAQFDLQGVQGRRLRAPELRGIDRNPEDSPFSFRLERAGGQEASRRGVQPCPDGMGGGGGPAKSQFGFYDGLAGGKDIGMDIAVLDITIGKPQEIHAAEDP